MNGLEQWLATEVHRIWLLVERSLRELQVANTRPGPAHPALAEVEHVLSMRRAARLGAPSAPEDDATLAGLIESVETTLFQLRRRVVIGRVVEALGLRPLEIETLVIAVALQVDSNLGDAFAILRGGGMRRGLDLVLVGTLLRLDRAHRVRLLDAVDPERPLLRWRLVEMMAFDSVEAFGSISQRPLRPTFDLISVLRGELSRFASIRCDAATLDDLRLDVATRREVQSLCDAAKRDPSGIASTWLVLWGPPGIGKKTVAARIASYGGRPLVVFDPSAMDRATFDDRFLRVQREALIRGALLYVGPLSPELLTIGARELFQRLSRFAGPVAFGIDGTQAPRLVSDHPLWELELPMPSEATRTQLWTDGLPPESCGDDLDIQTLARGFVLSPGEILASAHEARLIAEREGARVTHVEVRACVARRLRNDLGELARQVVVTTQWSDLVLPPQEMDRVQEFIARKQFADRVYNDWGYGSRVGNGKGLIALFSGPPGTGKTMLAGLIARSLDLDLYQVDLGQVVSKWVGETEKQLGKVFDQAERAHAVLLFDEADSLFAKRTEVSSANDRYGNMAVNYLLQRLEQYSGVAVLTTNNDTSLDEALQRRLTLHLYLELPEVEERTRLWKSFMPSRAPVRLDIDFHALANEFELSGGYIKNAAVRAAFLAAAHGTPIGMELLRLASALELEDMGRVVWNRGATSRGDLRLQ